MSKITILSGGQTGVDRAAIDAALALGLPVGGWMPKGCRAEDGRIPERYAQHLQECESTRYEDRTAANVEAATGVIIVTRGALTPGTTMALQMAKDLARRWAVVDLAQHGLHFGPADVGPVCQGYQPYSMLDAGQEPRILIAGPRESKRPGIEIEARVAILALLAPHLLARMMRSAWSPTPQVETEAQ